MEILKVLIERLLGWPVAAIVLGIIFRHQTAAFGKRIERLTFKHGDTSVEAAVGKAEIQNVQVEASEVALGSLIPTKQGLPDEIQAARREALDYGKNLEPVREREEAVKAQLDSLAFAQGEPETFEVLVRNLAHIAWIAYSERIYRLIFGSQIAALKFLHENGRRPEVDIRNFFSDAAHRYSDFYGTYPFEKWVGFMEGQSLIIRSRNEATVEITKSGRGFLIWMTLEAVSEDRQG